MSVALYRKYRPGSFAQVKGQEHVTEPLQQALRNGRVHHAYLFSGPRGCGKTSAARILARSLNCEQGPTADPCGECEPCVALAPGGPGSIDVMEIDAASHGGVDDARELRERAFFAPAASRYKVYVVDEAHMVTREGFNALLKLVEEPPEHLKFVFATTEPDKVIGTIRSRTHHYPFRLLPPALLRELLADICATEGVQVEPAALPLVVRAGAGSARDALSIMEQILAGAQSGQVTHAMAVDLLGYTDAGLLDEVVDAFAAADGAAVFDIVNRLIEGGHEPRRFATDLLERFRDLMVLRAVPDAGTKGLLEHPPDQLERMVAQAGRMGQAELSRAADILHAGLTEMRGATSPRLLLELICARVLLPAASTAESALLSRLERVERRMAIDAAAPGREREADAKPSLSAGHLPEDGHEHQAAGHAGPGDGEVPPGEPVERASPASPDDGQRGSGTRGEEQGSREESPAPERAGEQPAAGEGALDVAALRRAWPDVLENVKHRRRVAWMILIGDVAVSAVDGNSLTLAFAKEGDRKGFGTSGSDQVLQQALQDVLGVRWEIRTSTGTAEQVADPASPGGGAGDPAVPPPATAVPDARPAPGGGNDPTSESASDSAAVPDPFPEQSESSGVVPGRRAEPSAPAAPPAGRLAGSPGDVPDTADDSDTPGAAAGMSDGDGSGDAGPSERSGRRAQRGAEPGEGGQEQQGDRARGDREERQERSPADPPADAGQRLSGMALIQRELGGQVIDEIDGS